MKRLGTITMHLPLVPPQTCEVIETLMESAFNYHHFVELLCEKACTNDADQTIIFLAHIHALNLWDYKQLDRLSNLYGEHPYFKPFFLLVQSVVGEKVNFEEVFEVAFDTIFRLEKKWMSIEIYKIIQESWRKLSWTTKDEEIMEYIEHLVEDDPQLSCYLPIIYRVKGLRDETTQMNYFQEALKLAQNYDNQLVVGYLLRDIAFSMQSYDTNAALKNLHEAEKIFEFLDDRTGRSWIFNSLGHVYMIRGEYNAAFQYYLNAYETRERFPLPYDVLPHNITLIYNLLGDGENALEWSKMSSETLVSVPKHLAYNYMQRAWALINLGKTTEAMSELNTARVLALKTGSEETLGFYWFALGLLEREEGNILSAIESFSQALDIGLRFATNECFYQLAKTEYLLFDDNPTDHVTRVWFDRFNERVSEDEIPGFYALSQILKAFYSIRQENYSVSRECLENAKRCSRKPSMEYLQNEIERLERIIDRLSS